MTPTPTPEPSKPTKPTIPKENPVNDYMLLELPNVDDVRIIDGEGDKKVKLYLPEQVKANKRAESHEGKLVKIGPLVNGTFTVGDTLVFSQHSEYKVRIDGKLYAFVRENDVICRTPYTPTDT